MRYYQIAITSPTTKKTINYSSILNGFTDPGALNIEFDVLMAAYANFKGYPTIKIWGVALQDIAQAANFNGMSIQLSAGMSKGLPLANPAQQGLLYAGTIFQAYGNWMGTDMSLDFVITASGETAANPANITMNWKAGTPLAQAIAATLSAAFPSLKQSINISPNLVLSHDETGYYLTLIEFAQYLEGITVNLLGSTYTGVQVVLRNGTFFVYDNSSQTNPIPIAFNDLVGQPTWLSPYEIQITTVLRADISVGNFVKLPTGFDGAPGLVQTQPSSLSQYADKSVFQGTFQVNAIRHVGNYRDPNGQAWVSIFNCAAAAP